MQSNNNTVISLPGQSITDANGNVWSIIGGSVAINGVIDPATSNVTEMAYENGLVWQKNTSNLWWSKATPSDAWFPPLGTAVDPIPNQHASANDAIVTTVGGAATGSISDASGNVWSIAGGQVTLNGVADTSTGNVIELAYANGQVWQENTAHLWWSKTTPADAWGPGAGTPSSPVLDITRVWTGGSAGAFDTAGAWTPSGIPQAGDTAVITAASLTMALGDATGVNVTLQNGAGLVFHTAGSYALGTLQGSGALALGYPTQSAVVSTTGIRLAGTALSVTEFVSSSSTLIVRGNSTLTGGASLTTQLIGTGSLPHGPLENDGTMTLSGSTLTTGVLTGTGVVRATANSTVSVIGTSASETIQLQSGHLYVGGGPIPSSTALQFLAPVTNFGATSAITLNTTQATEEVFAKSTPTAGELFLYNGSTLVADMHISGQAHIYASIVPPGSGPAGVLLTAYDTGHSLPIVAHV